MFLFNKIPIDDSSIFGETATVLKSVILFMRRSILRAMHCGFILFLISFPVMGQNLIINGDAELDPLANGWTSISMGTACYTGSNWRITGNQSGFPASMKGTHIFYSGCNSVSGELYQDVDVSSYSVTIDAETQDFNFSAYTCTYETYDGAQIIVEYRDQSGNILADYNTGINQNVLWTLFEDFRTVPKDTRTIRIRLLSIYGAGSSVDGYFDNLILTPNSQTADRYWVASNNSNWNKSSSWSLTSGGSGGASIPNASNNILFDQNGLGKCKLNIPVQVDGINIASGFSGTIDVNGKSFTVNGAATFLNGNIIDGANTSEITISSTERATFFGTTFGAAVNCTASNILLEGSVFQNTASFTKVGAGNDHWSGGNTFEDDVTFTHQGSDDFIPAYTTGNTFLGSVTYQPISGNLLPAYSGTNSYEGDLLINAPTQILNFGINGGVVLMTGSNDQDILDAGTSLVPSIETLIINTAGATSFLKTDLMVNNLTVNSTSKLTLKSGINFTTSNSIENNGDIVINSSSSFIQTTLGANLNSGTGSYKVKRKGNDAADSYNIWSSPIQTALIDAVFVGSSLCNIWAFDENQQVWSHDFAVGTTTNCFGNNITFSSSDVITGGDGIMDQGRGYFVPGTPVNNRKYNGQINNGDLFIPVVTTSIGHNLNWDNDDWNLLGNPYPSSLDADAFIQENAINNNRIDGAIYFWDGGDTVNGYNQHSDYATYNLLGGVNSGNSSNLPAGHIGTGQGFWVYATNNSNVVFNNSMRSSSNNQYFKTANSSTNHLAWFSLTTPSTFKNNILIGYNSQTTDAIDRGYDAHKLIGNTNVRFASKMGEHEFVIQATAPILVGDTKVIPLVIHSSETGLHQISAYKQENMPTDLKVYLRDHILGVDHDLSTSDYQFSLLANVNYDTRFELVFTHIITANNNNSGSKGTGTKDTVTVTDINDMHTLPFTLSQNQDHLIISNHQQQNGTLQLIDITGKVILSTKLNSHTHHTSLNWMGIAAGTYIVRITSHNKALLTQQVVKL